MREYVGYRETSHLKEYKCVWREKKREREREGDNQITVSEHPVDASTLSESFLSRIANG